jgi:hypothetical protein
MSDMHTSLSAIRNTLAVVGDAATGAKHTVDNIGTYGRVTAACQIIGAVALVGIFITIAVVGALKLKAKAS